MDSDGRTQMARHIPERGPRVVSNPYEVRNRQIRGSAEEQNPDSHPGG